MSPSLINGHDLSHWYTEEQSAERLSISVRSFQRLIADGKTKEFGYAPEKRKRTRGDGRKPESVFNPDEVDTLASLARQRIVPPGLVLPGIHSNGNAHNDFHRGEDEIPQGLAFALRFMEQLAGLLGKRQAPQLLGTSEGETHDETPARVDPDKLYLTIGEASQVSGLSKVLLKNLAPQIGFRDGQQWRIARANLADSANVAQLARSLSEVLSREAKA